jgi:hypothetical protein
VFSHPRNIVWLWDGPAPSPPPDTTYCVPSEGEVSAGVEYDGLAVPNAFAKAATPDALAKLLPKLPRLKHVYVDSPLIGGLSPKLLPCVTDLQIGGTSKVTLPTGPWPSLRSIRADEAKLDLRAAELPALEKLTMMMGGKRTWLEIAKLSKLWALQIGPMDDASIEQLSGLPLEILLFRRGSVSDLSRLKSFPKLTEFGAILCHEIRDLDPLAELPALTDLTFHDCAHLERVDAILALPKLENAMIYGCKDPDGKLLRVVKTLRGRGVNVMSELDA